MRIIGYILLTVAIVDLLLYGLFFASMGMLLLALVIGAVILGWFIHQYYLKQKPDAGWNLGKALEVSHPHKPVKTVAVIQRKVLSLGTLVLGSPGSGKTESFLLNYLYALEQHSPQSGCAVFDGKGDIDLYKKACAMGRRPDFFFSSELPGSDSINLLEGQCADVVDRLTRLLIGQTLSTSYYSDVQRAVLTRVVPLLLSMGKPASLRDLYVVLSVEQAGAVLLRQTKATMDPILHSLAQQWFAIKYAQRLKEIAGLLNRLFLFVNGEQTDRLNCYQPTIRIGDVIDANKTIYFHLPLTAFSRDLGIALVEMLGVEAKQRQLGGTDKLTLFPIVMDDWGAFFHEGFGAFSARCRSAAMPLSFAFQSMAQLKSVSQTFADELDDNLATKIIFRVQGEDTGLFALRLLGEYDTLMVSTSELGVREGTSISQGRQSRIELRDLKELVEGEAFISTLSKQQQRMINPLYRLRFALPPIDGWQEQSLPDAQDHDEGEGLGLWQRYMNPSVVRDIHSQANEVAEREARVL